MFRSLQIVIAIPMNSVKAFVSEAGRKKEREGGKEEEVIAPLPP